MSANPMSVNPLSGNPWWMPPNGALHGFAVDHLMKINLALLGACLVLAHLVLLVVILKRRGAPARRRKILLIEILSLGLFSALFAWMALTADRLWATSRWSAASPAAMQVEVVGAQFQWYFRYPGEDAVFGRTKPELVDAPAGNPLGIDPSDPDGRDDMVTSEMMLPVDREIDLRLRSLDVIHGFFIPGMRIKQDAVPGMVLHLHFTPVRTGEYAILCSQLCGLGHARMQARLHVLSESEYAAWIATHEKKQRGFTP